MNPKTLKALKASIAHWKRMERGKLRAPFERPSAMSCALCSLFLEIDCVGCPIYEASGERHCLDTPFWDAWSEWVFHGMKSKEFKSAACKEIRFLESLIPKRNI